MQTKIFSKKLLLALTIFVLANIQVPDALAVRAKLPLNRIETITVNGRTVTCALFRSRTKYVVAKRARGRGSVYQSVSGTRAQRDACKAIGQLGTVSIAELPSTDGLISDAAGSSAVSANAVSGTPPVLPDIPASSIKELFWRPGVIDGINSGTPSTEQCSELFGGTTDGTSGGFNACFLTQGVGYSFETVINAGISLCYMRNVPTQANFNAGVIGLVSGSFPNNNVAQIFTTPSGRNTRIVRVDANTGMGTDVIFIRVYGKSTNDANGDSYRFDLWHCQGSTVTGYETTQVRSNGQYISTNVDSIDGTSSSTVSAYLKRENGQLVFDASRARTAESSDLADGNTFLFKSSLEISPGNVIRNKTFDIFGSELHKGYSVTAVSGSTVAQLRFLEGASKSSFTPTVGSPFENTGGLEYRDTYYASAPANAYVSELSAVDFSTDSFYDAINPPPFDASPYSCSATPNIYVSMDLTSSALQSVQQLCEGARLDGMDFCRAEADVQNASTAWNTVCPH